MAYGVLPRKVGKTGDSICITIPIDWAKEYGIAYKQSVTVIPRTGFLVAIFPEANPKLTESDVSEIVAYLDRKIKRLNADVLN